MTNWTTLNSFRVQASLRFGIVMGCWFGGGLGALACAPDANVFPASDGGSFNPGGHGGTGGNGVAGNAGTGGLGVAGASTGGGGSAPNYTGDHLWSERYGSDSTDRTLGLAVDSLGSAVITGSFKGDLDIDGTILVNDTYEDLFLIKFNATGVKQWAQRFGSGGVDVGHAVAIGESDSVLIVGIFASPTLYFRDDLILSHSGSPSYDCFVARFNSNGYPEWAHNFGGFPWVYPLDIATDTTGNVLLVGGFQGSLDFGNGPIASAGAVSNVFVAKLDPQGGEQWAYPYGGSTNGQWARTVATDNSNNLIVAGGFAGSLDFGNGTDPLAAGATEDIFLVKFDSDGLALWSEDFGDGAYQEPWDVAVGPGDDIFVIGNFVGQLSLGGPKLTSVGNDDNYDIFIVKYNASGQYQWQKHFGNEHQQMAGSLSVDSVGNLVVTGFFEGTIDFGNGPLTSDGGVYDDIFVAKFSPDGTALWSHRYGDTAAQCGVITLFPCGSTAAFDLDGNTLFSGGFSGTIDFGGGPLTSVPGGSPNDFFITKFSP